MTTAPWRSGWLVDLAAGTYAAISSGGSGGGGGAGRYYFEATIVAARAEAKACVGLANPAFNLTNPQELDFAAGTYASLDGGLFVSNSDTKSDGWNGNPGPTIPSSGSGTPVGETIGIVFDNTLRTVWFRRSDAPSTWLGGGVSPTPDPTTGTHGYPISQVGISAGDNVFILCGAGWANFGGTSHAQLTLNCGGSAFVMTLPTNCTAWGSTVTLNPSDKDSYIVLSGGNLTMTTGDIPGPNQATSFVRSTVFR